MALVEEVFLVGLLFACGDEFPLIDESWWCERQMCKTLAVILQENDLLVGNQSFQYGNNLVEIPPRWLVVNQAISANGPFMFGESLRERREAAGPKRPIQARAGNFT